MSGNFNYHISSVDKTAINIAHMHIAHCTAFTITWPDKYNMQFFSMVN